MKGTIFKNGNTIIIEGTPKEIVECISELKEQCQFNITHTPIERFHTGAPYIDNPITTSESNTTAESCIDRCEFNYSHGTIFKIN